MKIDEDADVDDIPDTSVPEEFTKEHQIDLRFKMFETSDQAALKAFTDNDKHNLMTEKQIKELGFVQVKNGVQDYNGTELKSQVISKQLSINPMCV